MEGADSLKERNKAMTDALLAKKPVKLIVYDCVEEKFEYVKAMLTVLSGLNVDRGGLVRTKLYAYFDDVDSANAAASNAVHITYCRTRVRTGTFDVTHLVRDTRTATPDV